MDITCRNCGEPWDAYGARHGGDMDPSEYRDLIKGIGCPSCNGRPIYECGASDTTCSDFKEGRCERPDPLGCEHKVRWRYTDQFLSSLSDSTDGDEALDAAMDMEFEPHMIEDQVCQDISCGAAPLGCSDKRYCPRGGVR